MKILTYLTFSMLVSLGLNSRAAEKLKGDNLFHNCLYQLTFNAPPIVRATILPEYDRHQFFKQINEKFLEYSMGEEPLLQAESIGSMNLLPIYKFELGNEETAAKKIIITAGIHAGTEAHSVEEAIELIEHFEQQVLAGDNIHVTILPLLNPQGLLAGTRTAELGPVSRTVTQAEKNRLLALGRQKHEIDLNRSLKPSSSLPLQWLLGQALEGKQFDLALDLHGAAQKSDFFIISAAEDYGLGVRAMDKIPLKFKLESLSKTYPGEFPPYKLSGAGVAQSEAVGTVKTFMYGKYAPFSYTLEYPGQLDKSSIMKYFKKMVLALIEEV